MGNEEKDREDLSVTLSIMAREIVALSAQVTMMTQIVARLLTHEKGAVEDALQEPPFPARFEDMFGGAQDAIDSLRQTHREASKHVSALAHALREGRALDGPTP